MAHSRADLNRTLRILMSGLVLTGVIVLTGGAILAGWVVQRGLSPLNVLAEQAAAIDAGDLAHRFPVEGLPSELRPISARLNGLLGRLEASFQREQRFTSDVAHELRTPIAELRSLAEVGLLSAPSIHRKEELSQYFRDALDIAEQMQRLVTALLALARCESGLQVVNLERIEISGLVRDAWAPFNEQARSRELAADLILPPEAHVETDRTLLTAILANLFSNAVAYTPRLGRIHLEVASEDSFLALTLVNDCLELDPQDMEHLSEPFWRKERARSSSAHSGVGLTLVGAFARLLGVSVSYELPARESFRVTLRHPRAAAST